MSDSAEIYTQAVQNVKDLLARMPDGYGNAAAIASLRRLSETLSRRNTR